MTRGRLNHACDAPAPPLFPSDHAKACRPFAMRCLGSCRLWSPRRLRITPPSTDFFDPTLLGDETMQFMLPLGQIVDVRQYLASHMRNRERYLKRASMLHPELARLAHCTDRKSQTGSIIITVHYSAGSVRCAALHMHAKHRCRNAAGLIINPRPRSLPASSKQSCKSSAKPPRLHPAAQLPNGQSLLPKQGSRSSNDQRPVAQTSAVAVGIAFFSPSRHEKLNGSTSCPTSSTKTEKKGSFKSPQDDDTFRCYHGCLIV